MSDYEVPGGLLLVTSKLLEKVRAGELEGLSVKLAGVST